MSAVNGRFAGLQVTGIERFSREVVTRIGSGSLRVIRPVRPLHGLLGQAWEQTALPRKLQPGEVLWSPANTGPVGYHPHVVTVHDAAVFDHPEWFARRVRLAYWIIVARLIREADYITTPSEFTRQRLLQLFSVDPGRVRVVRAGSDVVWSWPEASAGARKTRSGPLRSSWPSRFGLATGGHDPRKNLGRLIRAWEIVRQYYPELQLVVVGGSASRVFTVPTPRVRGWLHFTGRVSDSELDGLYLAATVFVYPSLYEGFGLPPLEALQRGVPTVVSDVPALQETLHGLVHYVDPFNESSIADGVLAAIQAGAGHDLAMRENPSWAGLPTWGDTASAMRAVLDEAASRAAASR